MRKILLRFLVDDPWSLHNADGVPSIGIGWLLIPWAVFGVWWLYRNASNVETRSELAGTVGFWLAIPCLPLILTRVAPQLTRDGIPVFGYGFMFFIGFVAGAFAAARRARQCGFDADLIWDLGIWLFLPGIICARGMYLLFEHEHVFRDRHGVELLQAAVNLPDGGLVFYGGLIGGCLGLFAFAVRRHVKPLLLADMITPSLFIGLGFGRIGCFLYGCCYGDRCSLPWAARFPPGSVPFNVLVQKGFIAPDALATLPLHPTQIYSSVNAFLIAAILTAYFHRRSYDGAVLAVGWIIYPMTRFILEHLRGDEFGKYETAFTFSQWTSLVLSATGLVFLYWLTHRSVASAGMAASAGRNV